ncbi:hypothetical protein HN51_022636 [Arachis hypogaea]|uniref:F-box domain-containing protein n=1 Tax=Arachis hypogaea TaxID=3818 RepID=A0A445EB82_ARAHY|nr:F-box/kelch-repeat protein At3g06240 [Arachis hypogaea]QHO53931.1 F-box/kelch-repeat protein [Arachis hypogaea]RYR72796.1 hypothetical protein Ahy_A02g007006 [Arachis hypogaea]
MKPVKAVKTEMKELPQEVMVEIFLRLPVKSLLRFKCVCKHWLSLISDPNFAKHHFQRSSLNLTHKILYTLHFVAWSWDFNAPFVDHSALSRIQLPLAFVPANINWMRMVGSCRGFLLVALNDNILLNDLIIWNPSTGSCKRVPQPPTWDNKFAFLCGFGYDVSTDDYIIVQVSYKNWEAYLDDEVIIFETFSVKSNSWKIVDVHGLNCTYTNLRNDDVDTPRVGSFLNGYIHWLAWCKDGERANHGAIIAFDLNENKNGLRLHEVPLPDDFIHEYSDLGVFGGWLGLIEMNAPDQLNIRVMKEYGVKSSWVNLITVSLLNIPSDFISPMFMFLCRYGEVVGIYDGVGFVKYSDRGGELLEPPNNPHGRSRFYSTASVYTETLLSLPSNHGDQG